jgi:hypothetical protein
MLGTEESTKPSPPQPAKLVDLDRRTVRESPMEVDMGGMWDIDRNRIVTFPCYRLSESIPGWPLEWHEEVLVWDYAEDSLRKIRLAKPDLLD